MVTISSVAVSYTHLKDLDVIAEDLGFLTDSVRELLAESGYPGMKVLQFAFDESGESVYLPFRYDKNCIVYTGTHDNETTKGWLGNLTQSNRAYVNQYTACEDVYKRQVVASVLLVTLTGNNALNLFPSIFDPSQGWRAYVLPCFALGFYPMCYTARQTRSAMLDSLSQEYIKTARAKGLKNKKIIFKHALRNALIPVITYLGPQVAFTLCGGFVVESVFSIPGLGRYFVQSIQNRRCV